MNPSKLGFSRMGVFAAIAAVVLLFILFARNFTLAPLIKERHAVSSTELMEKGARMEVLQIGDDPTRVQIRVTVGDAPSPYTFTAASLCVTNQEINKAVLTQMLAKNALPVCVRDEASREHVSSFFVTRAEIEKSFVTVLYHRSDKLRFWGSDVREYLVPVTMEHRTP